MKAKPFIALIGVVMVFIGLTVWKDFSVAMTVCGFMVFYDTVIKKGY